MVAESTADKNENFLEKDSSIHKQAQESINDVLVETTTEEESRQEENVNETDDSSREEDSDTFESQKEQKSPRTRDETDQMYDFLLESLSDSEMSGGTTALYESYLKQNKNDKSKGEDTDESSGCSSSSEGATVTEHDKEPKREVPKKTVPQSTVEAVKRRLERIQLKKKGIVPEDDETVKSICTPPPIYGNTAKEIEENQLTCFDDMCVLLNPVELLNRWEAPCVAAEQLYPEDDIYGPKRRIRRSRPSQKGKDSPRRKGKGGMPKRGEGRTPQKEGMYKNRRNEKTPRENTQSRRKLAQAERSSMREKLKNKFQAMDPAKRQEWRKRFEMDKARKLKEKELKRREMERMEIEKKEKTRRNEIEQQRVRHGKRNRNTGTRKKVRDVRNNRRPTRGRKKEVRRTRSSSSSSSSGESMDGTKIFAM